MAKETYINARKTNFTMVSNTLLNDKAVTLQAKGLLSIFISNDTDKFTIHMKEIITRSKNGRDAHYKVVDELIKHGYFARVEIREAGKFVEMVYIFSDDKADVAEALKQFEGNENAIINPDKKKKNVDNVDNSKSYDISNVDNVDNVDKVPNPESQETVPNVKKPLPENQDTEIQDTENPETENQYNNNTNLNYTNLNNTKVNNINQSIDQELNEISNNVMPMQIKKVVSLNKERLIDDNITVIEILTFYRSSDNTVNDMDFNYILSNVLKKTKTKIGNFSAVMKKAFDNHYKEYNDNLMPNAHETHEETEPFLSFLDSRYNDDLPY
jgi:hypothetical protein